MKKRFSRDLEAIVQLRKEIVAELEVLETCDDEILEIEHEIRKQTQAVAERCQQLSAKREAAVSSLERLIPDILESMGMNGSRFKVNLEYQDDPDGIAFGEHVYRVTPDGMDIATFLLSTNAGEALRPLARVASGGEISRIMLALKSAIAREGQIPTLLFDEIDNGVSGRIGGAVGKRLRDLGRYHQVLCITHLPQIASMGEHHWFVEKAAQGGRTITRFRKLTAEERPREIAKLMAGETLTDANLNSARELLHEAAQKKDPR